MAEGWSLSLFPLPYSPVSALTVSGQHATGDDVEGGVVEGPPAKRRRGNNQPCHTDLPSSRHDGQGGDGGSGGRRGVGGSCVHTAATGISSNAAHTPMDVQPPESGGSGKHSGAACTTLVVRRVVYSPPPVTPRSFCDIRTMIVASSLLRPSRAQGGAMIVHTSETRLAARRPSDSRPRDIPIIGSNGSPFRHKGRCRTPGGMCDSDTWSVDYYERMIGRSLQMVLRQDGSMPSPLLRAGACKQGLLSLTRSAPLPKRISAQPLSQSVLVGYGRTGGPFGGATITIGTPEFAEPRSTAPATDMPGAATTPAGMCMVVASVVQHGWEDAEEWVAGQAQRRRVSVENTILTSKAARRRRAKESCRRAAKSPGSPMKCRMIRRGLWAKVFGKHNRKLVYV
jgi:hypothetical protein